MLIIFDCSQVQGGDSYYKKFESIWNEYHCLAFAWRALGWVVKDCLLE